MRSYKEKVEGGLFWLISDTFSGFVHDLIRICMLNCSILVCAPIVNEHTGPFSG